MNSSNCRFRARENLAGNWGMSILVAFVAALLGGAIAGGSFDLNVDAEVLSQLPPAVLKIITIWTSIASVLGLIQFVVGGPVKLGNCQYLLHQHDKEEMSIHDLFSEFGRWGAGFALNLLTGLFVGLWTMLFIIPGIVASYRYAMAPFILAENPEMSASEAITRSKEIMNGHKGELFTLDLSFIGWSLLCVLTCGIGYLFLNPYIAASRAAFYRDLCPKYIPDPVPEIPANTPWDF